MSLLALQDLGKIYVSEGNVTVGIRGVNLSFDRGEFVAVTGKSGSGKSTLLNVISGMDSYEEGEMYIEGQTTSHYLQPEWEQYREKYISFIFQDYNIIDSFTVLQNVELALMHIEDKRERRKRATELISRVGLSSHINQKGSKLSGGQKQRTVIARALAKDSPIILADEPTGNLDSSTSKEIIELLKEVSKDKLLIVVTHNFDEVKEHATRHIRVFDGSIESDHIIGEEKHVKEAVSSANQLDKKQEVKKQIKNGLTLGKTIFAAKPKLSVFLCFLMIVGILVIFAVTTLCGEAIDLFEPYYMFNHIDGRVVIAKQNAEVITDDEVKDLAQKYGAQSYLHYDVLLDTGVRSQIMIPCGDIQRDYKYVSANYVYGKTYGENIVGRYPTNGDEVFLYLPISYQPYVGKDSILVENIAVNSMNLKLVGVKYYYDNNKTPECLFTEDGFRVATAIYYLLYRAETQITVTVSALDGTSAHNFGIYQICPSFDMPKDKIYLKSQAYDNITKEMEYNEKDFDVSIDLLAIYYNYNYNYGYDASSKSMTFSKSFDKSDLADQMPQYNSFGAYDTYNSMFISDELLCEIAEEVLNNSYKQASLFFENDKEAHTVAEKMQKAGYLAVPSDTTYEPSAEETIINVLTCIMMGFVWIMAVIFLAFFINLCSSRALGAFKGDMAIMRSMGIQVKVIRIAMYVRMLISLIPSIILLAVTAILIFTTPRFNEYFVYLYAWQYALIVIGMLVLTVRITHKQIGKLFASSVKKSLKGGRSE